MMGEVAHISRERAARERPRVVLLPSLGEVAHIQRVVAAYYGIPVGSMKSADRHRSVARPRQVAMFLAREITGKSLPQIGRLFGNLNHTTVIHAIRAVTQRMAEDRRYRADVEALREAVR